MKRLLALVVLTLCVGMSAYAQDSQVSASFVLRDQTRLGYQPHTLGAKLEGVYKLKMTKWVVVAYATGLASRKVDSGTGKSGFLSLGTRWTPITYKGVGVFGEFDAILGALVTDPYRKTVFHFRNAVGAKFLDGHLLVDVARLYQDILPDAVKLFKQGNPAWIHTTFNQLSGWDYEAYYWTHPLKEGAKWGAKGGLRYSTSKFARSEAGDKGTGWLLQFEIGPYWRF